MQRLTPWPWTIALLPAAGGLLVAALAAALGPAGRGPAAALTWGALTALTLAVVCALRLRRFLHRRLGAARELTDRMLDGAAPGIPRPDPLEGLEGALRTLERRLHERVELLERERTELAASLAGMSEGVVALDSEERIVHINIAARRLLNLPEDSGRGDRIWEVVRSQRILAALREVADGVSGRQAGSAGVDLGPRFLGLHTSPIAGGGAVLVVHDLTDLRRLEEVRRDFVANVSHELKTPVTAVVGVVETLLGDEDMPAATRRHFLERAAQQGRRLSALVSDLLTLSRLEAGGDGGDFEPVDFAALTRTATDGMRPAATGRGLTWEATIEPAWVQGDAEALRQTVDNLLTNALRYTPAGGTVTVSLAPQDGEVELVVRDTGIGIERQHLERIFERFYRVESARSRELGGTGLGLAIVKHAVRSHGGDVVVESSPGRGSSFRVRLPAAPPPERAREP